MEQHALRARAFSALAFALVTALLVASCGGGDDSGAAPTSANGMPVIELRAPDGALRVEVARTVDERALGLSNRDRLDDGAGMLFDLGETRRATFVMRDMRFALDMVWIDAGRRVAGVTANAQPAPPGSMGPPYGSPGEVRYVLEVTAGVAGELGIAEGAELDFTLP